MQEIKKNKNNFDKNNGQPKENVVNNYIIIDANGNVDNSPESRKKIIDEVNNEKNNIDKSFEKGDVKVKVVSNPTTNMEKNIVKKTENPQKKSDYKDKKNNNLASNELKMLESRSRVKKNKNKMKLKRRKN